MWIVEVTGGLGNQMFQYAFGYALRQKRPNVEVKYDLSYYNASSAIRKYELGIFDLDEVVTSNDDVRRVRGFFQYDNKIQKLVYRFAGKHDASGIEVIEDLDSDETDYIVENDNAYFSGYWQSEKFFKEYENDVRDLFKFPVEDMSNEYRSVLGEIEGTNSVSIHVRLEDYLNDENFRVYGNICTQEYYTKAIEYINEKHGKCTFFVFTTDKEKALEVLPGTENYRFIDAKSSVDYLDMYLMTRCKNNIIANSTFSWWGAWLNDNPDKTVVCPGKWLNNHPVNKQICDAWVRI